MKKPKVFDVRPSTANELPRILELNKAAIPAVNFLNDVRKLWNLFSQAVYFQ